MIELTLYFGPDDLPAPQWLQHWVDTSGLEPNRVTTLWPLVIKFERPGVTTITAHLVPPEGVGESVTTRPVTTVAVEPLPAVLRLWHARHQTRPGYYGMQIGDLVRGRGADRLAALAGVLGVTAGQLMTAPDCDTCQGAPPAGFTCNACGRGGTQ